ncbi:hypothetical protein [Amycolatopsis acididurans]|nr:hypothetical protein [Amycolatopsis acididurans]
MVHMAMMGLLTSVLAPVLVLAGQRFVPWQRVPASALITLPVFLVLHGALTIVMARQEFPVVVDTALHAVLLAGAMWFWLPVLRPGPGLPEPARAVYLFLAAPSLDLAAVVLIILGDETGGLAMIVGMLPLGLVAIAVTWRWITREERLAQQQEVGA